METDAWGTDAGTGEKLLFPINLRIYKPELV
jgi:hypothetical protein